MPSLGQVAYEAYCESVDWKSVAGVDLPSWDNQTVRLRAAWDAAGQAVADFLYHQNREVYTDDPSNVDS